MKKRYLGFIPASVILIYSHYQVIWGYIEFQKTGYIWSINPICMAVVFFFWGVISLYGIFYALGLYD